MDDMERKSRERSERVSKFIDERFAESWERHSSWTFKIQKEPPPKELAKMFFAAGVWKSFGALDQIVAAWPQDDRRHQVEAWLGKRG